MKIQNIFFFVAFSLAFIQCKKENQQPPADVNVVDFSCSEQPTVCELTSANGNFAIDIFKQINSEEAADKNIFISPFSISTALTMTTNGAVSQTLEDMRNTLKINNLEMSGVNASYKTLLATLPNLDANTQLKLANSIWPQEGYPVLQSFLDNNANNFSSEVIPVDFKQQSVAVNKVNTWVEDKTNGLIKETLTEIPSDLVMLLINAIYFKGTWKTKFDAANTQQADFHAPNGTVSVDMMHIPTGDFSYFSNEIFQAVDLPYGDSIFSMSIFLPKEGHDVNDITTAMNATAWDNWLASFYNQNVELYLPKFKMEYDIKLKRSLSDLGMGLAFSDVADFSNMIENGGVKIDEVIHKSFIEVDEKGTKAAAVTVVQIVDTAAAIPQIVNVNHPFVFVIRDNKTNSILFMGKMMNPNN